MHMVLPLDRASAQRAVEVRRYLEGRGQSIGMADSLIAGIALHHQLPVFTRNREYFERVPALSLVEVPKLRPYAGAARAPNRMAASSR